MRNYRARGISKDGRPIFDETHEHCVVAEWLDANKVFYAHPANGEWRHPVTAKKLKRMGVKAGCPDFLIFQPSGAHNKPTALELKALDGRAPSVDQVAFMAGLELCGWVIGWHRGADTAIKWLESLGYARMS